MRKAASELRWQGKSVLVALALALGFVGLVLLYSDVKAGPPFPAFATTDVTNTEHLANSDILSTFGVEDDPWPAAMYEVQISFTPQEWGVPDSDDLPIGAVVGKLHADSTLGWFNSPCAAAYGGSLGLDFDPLMNCSIDTSDTIAYTDPGFFTDTDGNGLPGGCDKYPAFLNTMFPGMTPKTRHAGFEYIGINVTLSFMTFEPGTAIPGTAAPGVPSFSPAMGYVAMSVLNDPTGPLVPNQITDMCPPLGTQTTYYGLSKNNPLTPDNEAGYAWRTNPWCGGTYTFNGYARSMRDADNDGIDNELDTCPHITNVGDPRVRYSGDPDDDGLDSACDPEPTTANVFWDADSFPNRQDNCPLVDNEDQADADFDGIGDACDQPDWNDDGDTTDPGEPTGFSAGTPNGSNTALYFTSDVDIDGPEVGEDGDDDGFDDCEEEALGSDPEDDLSTPEHKLAAGTCNDNIDNDLDGYIDEVDGGCEKDSDGDGASDEGEDDLGSDPDDENSTPEHADVAGTCNDGADNDLDGDTDGDDEGCAGAPTDTDGDGWDDDVEEEYGSDPNDADSTPEDTAFDEEFDEDSCTDGVDNDLDGDIDDEDAGCAAVAGTPTPTVVAGTPTPTVETGTPTPTPEGTVAPTVEAEICTPVFPGLYNGRVLKDGSPAAAGWEVTASIDGVEWASAIVSGGRYVMDIPNRLPTDDCFEPGTITFKLDGMTCEPTQEWASGGPHEVDLNCVSAEVTPTPTVEPTPTPTVEPTPTVQPTPTPTVLPPTGMGGMSGDGSFMWWPLALAAAAITSAAGLGTLVTAKRR